MTSLRVRAYSEFVSGGPSAGGLSEAAMLLDVFYLAIGVLSVVLCWSFVKACDRL